MKIRLLLSGYLLVNSMLLQANERWFEVEMIVFERTADSQLREQFPEQVTPIRLGRNIDLLTPLLTPEIAPLLSAFTPCHPPAIATATASVFPANFAMPSGLLCLQETQALAWQRSNIFPETQLHRQVPWPQQIPYRILGSPSHLSEPYLADESALAMTELAQRLRRQRQHNVLLHTVWRQAPVTERRAIPSRWFAGQNFSQQFDYWGQPLSTTPDEALDETLANVVETADKSSLDLLEQIASRQQQLAAGVSLDQPATAVSSESTLQSEANLPSAVWQLDGLFKLHLDHYLFVNTDFNLRRLNDDTLTSVNIKQSRRVISGEIHYLDHPKLGMIIQIRRYQPPEGPTE